MNILITGATGYLGKHLVNRLSSHNIYTINSKNHNLLEKVPNIYPNIDIIFHLAAWTKAGDFCLYHQGEQWVNNQLINTNILDYWVKYQKQAKMICMGTSCGYDPLISPKTEDKYLLGLPDKDLYTYGMTKRMLLIGLQSIHQQHGLNYLYFIPNTLFGPQFDINDSHFIFDLIKKICAGKYENAEVRLWGNGYQKRELVFINDAIKFILEHISNNNEIINICTGYEYSIREYSSIICDIIDYSSSNIIYDESKFQGASSKVLCPNKYGSCNYTTLSSALYETINYYRRHKYAM